MTTSRTVGVATAYDSAHGQVEVTDRHRERVAQVDRLGGVRGPYQSRTVPVLFQISKPTTVHDGMFVQARALVFDVVPAAAVANVTSWRA
ncbi:hypothetical protein GCM10023194_25050 [Planotetraspora phitsanulokensis]|uniref:Uncharacterized protein n=1 Tax=Planotetraspora phitsanulokensis TaxID=575192 RepID=A0A8J3UH30_9ACTN|nr:hypothetical protein Pph01_85600 [Planotetraspora phitsanulokensis]